MLSQLKTHYAIDYQSFVGLCVKKVETYFRNANKPFRAVR